MKSTHLYIIGLFLFFLVIGFQNLHMVAGGEWSAIIVTNLTEKHLKFIGLLNMLMVRLDKGCNSLNLQLKLFCFKRKYFRQIHQLIFLNLKSIFGFLLKQKDRHIFSTNAVNALNTTVDWHFPFLIDRHPITRYQYCQWKDTCYISNK
jgi:hypothetical protein